MMRLYGSVFVAVDVQTGAEEEFLTAAKAASAAGVSVDAVRSGRSVGRLRWEERVVWYEVVSRTGQALMCRWDADRKVLVSLEGGVELQRRWCESIRRIGCERIQG